MAFRVALMSIGQNCRKENCSFAPPQLDAAASPKLLLHTNVSEDSTATVICREILRTVALFSSFLIHSERHIGSSVMRAKWMNLHTNIRDNSSVRIKIIGGSATPTSMCVAMCSSIVLYSERDSAIMESSSDGSDDVGSLVLSTQIVNNGSFQFKMNIGAPIYDVAAMSSIAAYGGGGAHLLVQQNYNLQLFTQVEESSVVKFMQEKTTRMIRSVALLSAISHTSGSVANQISMSDVGDLSTPPLSLFCTVQSSSVNITLFRAQGIAACASVVATTLNPAAHHTTNMTINSVEVRTVINETSAFSLMSTETGDSANGIGVLGAIVLNAVEALAPVLNLGRSSVSAKSSFITSIDALQREASPSLLFL